MFSSRVRSLAVSSVVSAVVSWVAPAAAAVQPKEPIDINTATKEELAELPRIGEVTAARIVEWREENGPFASTEELMNIQGIGERVYERIRPHVRVGKTPEESSGDPSAIPEAPPALSRGAPTLA